MGGYYCTQLPTGDRVQEMGETGVVAGISGFLRGVDWTGAAL